MSGTKSLYLLTCAIILALAAVILNTGTESTRDAAPVALGAIALVEPNAVMLEAPVLPEPEIVIPAGDEPDPAGVTRTMRRGYLSNAYARRGTLAGDYAVVQRCVLALLLADGRADFPPYAKRYKPEAGLRMVNADGAWYEWQVGEFPSYDLLHDAVLNGLPLDAADIAVLQRERDALYLRAMETLQ